MNEQIDKVMDDLSNQLKINITQAAKTNSRLEAINVFRDFKNITKQLTNNGENTGYSLTYVVNTLLGMLNPEYKGDLEDIDMNEPRNKSLQTFADVLIAFLDQERMPHHVTNETNRLISVIGNFASDRGVCLSTISNEKLE